MILHLFGLMWRLEVFKLSNKKTRSISLAFLVIINAVDYFLLAKSLLIIFSAAPSLNHSICCSL